MTSGLCAVTCLLSGLQCLMSEHRVCW